MTRGQLKLGARVLHVKHNKQYAILDFQSRMKDSSGEWIDCVIYYPLYENPYYYFCREIESFLEEFELV